MVTLVRPCTRYLSSSLPASKGNNLISFQERGVKGAPIRQEGEFEYDIEQTKPVAKTDLDGFIRHAKISTNCTKERTN